MTGPIKPPGSPKAPGLESPSETQRNAETADAFKGAVSIASENATERTATKTAEGVSAALSAELRAGTLESAGAVERLIADALASSAASGLSTAGKQALENHLRSTLAEDPALSALVNDLDR